MAAMTETIIYTETDEAPRLATFSLLPIIKAFSDAAGVQVETRDISLAGRILAAFPERLGQPAPDHLAELGGMTGRPDANIIKLPNISASTPQLLEAIKELQGKGHDLPDYPEDPQTDAERQARARYDKVKGSAVNPVLREGNSDRRAATAVKNYAKRHPHRMGAWSPASRSHVAHMTEGDFYGSEKSVTMAAEASLKVEFAGKGKPGKRTLATGIAVEKGEVVDAAFMSKKALCAFLDEQLAATEEGLLFSLHLKATMMKVSDPIIFGHAVRAYYKEALAKHAAALKPLGIDLRNGIGDVYDKLRQLPAAEAKAIKADLDACLTRGPALAMVNSDKGVTNLHVPSDIIIDASMPAAIRESGKMWGPDGELHDMKAVIPDRCYAGVYAETIAHCIAHGAFDPATMGSIPNVGLMAQRAEEYGSHDTTFEAPGEGTIKVLDSAGKTLLEHQVEAGDIWRLCRVKDAPVRDWVKLAVNRARATGWPLVFWLDRQRSHDAELIKKVEACLLDEDLEHHIMAPADATRFSLERLRAGESAISVTGNVLRDYLTDLFPILELGTSAKMLSIVPLMNGGGLFETGAGGSAPKHVQQFQAEGHLRWDSLGEFLALGASLEHLAARAGNARAQILADTLNQAIAKFLETNKSPSRKVNELDNRGSHFYLALYWAEAMGAQGEDAALGRKFTALAQRLRDQEDTINKELLAAQGQPVDLGGYYLPDPALAAAAMRPSASFNAALEAVMA